MNLGYGRSLSLFTHLVSAKFLTFPNEFLSGGLGNCESCDWFHSQQINILCLNYLFHIKKNPS